MTAVPWTACALIYSLVHCTYPRDKRKVARAAFALPVTVADSGPLPTARSGLDEDAPNGETDSLRLVSGRAWSDWGGHA
jgi:hypothetical protein